MIKIPTSEANILKAKRQFYEEIAIPVLDRIDVAAETKGVSRVILDEIESQLQDILIGEPAIIFGISTAFNLKHGTGLKNTLKDIFDYKWFTEKKSAYDAYDLAAALNVNVCVYCNRNYTHTIITNSRKKKVTRPTFDHYFSKGVHPLLGLSFYNLIPSCGVCNSGVKHAADFNLTTHYHPYLSDYLNEYSFSYEYTSKTPSGLGILLHTTTPKSGKTLGDLQTEVIYNSHDYELKVLLDMRYKFSDNYLTILEDNILKGVQISTEELYSIAFGSEIDQKKFGHRPFSKFKSDILKELGIIV